MPRSRPSETMAESVETLAGLSDRARKMRRAADDMSDDEVARARAQMKAGLLMGLESPSNRAERMARMLSIWGRVCGGRPAGQPEAGGDRQASVPHEPAPAGSTLTQRDWVRMEFPPTSLVV